ncbi:Theileria parva Tpr-related protein, putative [Theileria annulata]|uniref:Theileria parva Tpr-related protein, putative n=1 Tax=Theileria annulata TaxID=5874 RepID=Q4UGM9_THEAN|nr:Theileria parva Tpr-related protein, putative [Theileria annulata]CAI73760.1 Theileria parva Tpr-related protein, putative [Theileria annulata]|eukprot:XP_954437.1 Theileria parva Tpr-related protein, putative [Theileria annulata]
MKLAGDSKLTNDDKVTAVIKAYLEVKNTYYQMLIRYRIQKKAEPFYSAANALKDAAKAQTSQPQTPLGKLQGAAGPEMDTLVRTAETLKGIELGTDDSNIVQKYLAVADEYGKLSSKKEFKDASSEREVQEVTKAFEALQNSYVNVIRLRVQELANLAETLKNKATEANSVSGLDGKATALRDAASQDQNGLKQKADLLVKAINSGQPTYEKATDVIKQFVKVKEAYEALENQAKYQQLLDKAKEQIAEGQPLSDGDEQNVKNVDDAYNDLKKLYDKILKFAKVKYYSEQLHSAASGGNAENVINNFNSLVDSYSKLGTNKSIVKTQFTDLQKVYSEAIYFYKKCVLAWTSIITNWLNFLTFVILLIVFVTGGDDPGRSGCEGTASAAPQTINSVKLAISGSTHTITLSDGGNTNGTLTHTSEKAITLKGSGTGTLTIKLPGGEIKLTQLTISGNTLTIKNGSRVSVTKDDDTKIKLQQSGGATLNSNQLTLEKDEDGGRDAANISGQSTVTLDYGTGGGHITINGSAISDLRKYEPSLSPQYFDGATTFRFKKWSEYPAGKFYLGFNILMVIKISLAGIFIYSLHYKDSNISRAIVNQPKMSTALSILFYMCHGSH